MPFQQFDVSKLHIRPLGERVHDIDIAVNMPPDEPARRIDDPRYDLLADAIRAAGIEFRLWGVNAPESLRYARDLGAAGFTCNYWHAAFDWAAELGGVELLP